MLKTINAWAFDAQKSIDYVFASARDNGFQAVELTVGEGPEGGNVINPNSTDAELAAIAAKAKEYGLALPSVASGQGWGNPCTTEDAAIRAKSIEVVARGLEVTAALGAGALLWVPGGVGAEFIPGFLNTPYDKAYDNALAAARELVKVAEKNNVTLAIENVWNKFLLSPLEMRDFIDKVGSDNFGCYFDAGNVILTGFAEQWISILGKRVSRVHLKDFKRSVGTLDGFCDLLDGDVDYPAVMAALRAVGYDGPVTAEFFNAEADLPKISAAIDKILAM